MNIFSLTKFNVINLLSFTGVWTSRTIESSKCMYIQKVYVDLHIFLTVFIIIRRRRTLSIIKFYCIIHIVFSISLIQKTYHHTNNCQSAKQLVKNTSFILSTCPISINLLRQVDSLGKPNNSNFRNTLRYNPTRRCAVFSLHEHNEHYPTIILFNIIALLSYEYNT